ncbi:gliding motility lipoprotein GldD [Crocinitomix catalasitica]|uniref:gliding motility lipoprotein GldD n=1 Tax=Crocinitomix catalasitica TaxID=184607 RepID=UPI000481221A|nr:hypothetical protein [Crocinitomix catalasitica]
MKINLTIIGIVFLSFFGILACDEEVDYYPKPRGFMRLDFPERTYQSYQDDSCHYSFELPDYFSVVDKENCNKNIEIKRFNATLFLTYQPIDTNLFMHLEYARKLVYDHSIKADEILEKQTIDTTRDIYGVNYMIVGDAASPYQFYLTDSTNHFLRGALYFNVKPNYDSIRTSLEYLIEDFDHMIGTAKWN